MFQVDDVIIYGSHGVCRIVELSQQRINGCKKTYYVLKPVQDQGATIFAPVDHENVRRKMRRLLSQEQILYNEIQYVLQLESKEALMDYIVSRMEKRSI